MRQLYLFTLLLLAHFTQASDAIKFDVILYGKKIGSMTINKEVRNDTVSYVLQGRSTAKILWMEYDDISRYEVKYKGDKILYCKYKEDMNGKLKHFTELTYDGKEYKATTKSGIKKITPDVAPSLLWLYYNEPVNVSKIFYEAQLISTPLEMKNPGHYIFKNNEGHNNEYIYRNGRLEELIFETPIATVRMKRAN